MRPGLSAEGAWSGAAQRPQQRDAGMSKGLGRQAEELRRLPAPRSPRGASASAPVTPTSSSDPASACAGHPDGVALPTWMLAAAVVAGSGGGHSPLLGMLAALACPRVPSAGTGGSGRRAGELRRGAAHVPPGWGHFPPRDVGSAVGSTGSRGMHPGCAFPLWDAGAPVLCTLRRAAVLEMLAAALGLLLEFIAASAWAALPNSWFHIDWPVDVRCVRSAPRRPGLWYC